MDFPEFWRLTEQEWDTLIRRATLGKCRHCKERVWAQDRERNECPHCDKEP